MKKNLLRFTVILMLTGLLSSCMEEEITPNDQLNSGDKKEGVTEDDKGF